MQLKGRAYYIRKLHRYLGVFIGVQFLLWTLGGLYFSWTDLSEIHGDHFGGANPKIDGSQVRVISPTGAIEAAGDDCMSVDLTKLRLVSIKGDAFYSFNCSAESGGSPAKLVNAITGAMREQITAAEAAEIATSSLVKPFELESTEFLTAEDVGPHHEYRAKALPAWAVTFKDAEGLTAYVSAADGQVQALRTDNWRAFDLLWMLHTMDFAGRDNINNYVLRGFSILGIVTVFSGFLLYFTSSKTIRRFFGRRAATAKGRT